MALPPLLFFWNFSTSAAAPEGQGAIFGLRYSLKTCKWWRWWQALGGNMAWPSHVPCPFHHFTPALWSIPPQLTTTNHNQSQQLQLLSYQFFQRKSTTRLQHLNWLTNLAMVSKTSDWRRWKPKVQQGETGMVHGFIPFIGQNPFEVQTPVILVSWLSIWINGLYGGLTLVFWEVFIKHQTLTTN